MTAKSPFDPKHWPKMEGFPDLLATQQRSFEAMTKAGQILGEAMRQCAERQMHAAKSAFDQLMTQTPKPMPVSPEAGWREHSEKLQEQIQQLAQHISAMHEIMVQAHQAALGELQSVWTQAGGDTRTYPATPPKAAPAPAAAKPAPAPATAPVEPRPMVKPVVIVSNHTAPPAATPAPANHVAVAPAPRPAPVPAPAPVASAPVAPAAVAPATVAAPPAAAAPIALPEAKAAAPKRAPAPRGPKKTPSKS